MSVVHLSTLPAYNTDPASDDYAIAVRQIGAAGAGSATAANQDAQTALLTTINDSLNDIETAAESTTPASVIGYAFDLVSAPTVTNGAYSAGDIVGGLLTFAAARAVDEAVIVTGIQISLKVAVTSALSVILFEADPTNTTKTDNAAYSLSALDVFKFRRAVTGFVLYDHGTPNTYSIEGLNIVMKPASGTQNIFALVVDGSGWTFTSTSDMQVRICGMGA